MRNAIEKQLVGRGFTVKVPPEYLGGQNNKNFINREDNNTGVQLELTTALRKAFFKNGDTSTKIVPTKKIGHPQCKNSLMLYMKLSIKLIHKIFLINDKQQYLT